MQHEDTNRKLIELFAYLANHDLPTPMAVFVTDSATKDPVFELRYGQLSDLTSWWKRCQALNGKCSGSYARGTMRLQQVVDYVGTVCVDVALERQQKADLILRHGVAVDAVTELKPAVIEDLIRPAPRCSALAGVRGQWRGCEALAGERHDIHSHGTLRWLGDRTVWGARDNEGRPIIWNRTATP